MVSLSLIGSEPFNYLLDELPDAPRELLPELNEPELLELEPELKLPELELEPEL